MAKEVQLSDDNGTTWYTLPGSSGEISVEGDAITDTIFGQTFKSEFTGLISWTLSAGALYKGFAGYLAKIRKGGTSTVMTGEAMSQVGSTKTWKINDSTKEIWDRNVAVVVKDGGVAVNSSDIDSINYLFGEVTFAASYTPTGAITVDGAFLPTITVAKVQNYTLTQTAETKDKTDFDTARTNGGFKIFEPGLRTVTLQLSGFYDANVDQLTNLTSRNEVIIEINPDGSGMSLARGFFRMTSKSQSGDVGALEEETLNFSLSVPENINTVFNWQHQTNTTLSTAVKKALDSWLNQTMIDVRYLPDGPGTGNVSFSGNSMITDISLSGSLDGLNEFTANFQGSGPLTRSTL